ncbi:MAG: hypothetical protein KatS3mg051_1160 [Anaerolineae bacterium]|nr:MAG: hypothetical protein KatS3mg051_1160 [Anaerolineae bacterium]
MKLMPCPWCSGENLETFMLDEVVFVRCRDCCAAGPQVLVAEYEDDLAAELQAKIEWNRRSGGKTDGLRT